MRVVFLLITAFAVALIPQAKNGGDPARSSAELQVLDRFVGTWDFAVTNTLAGGETVTGKTSETRRWTLGNKFVQWENSRSEKPDEPEFQMLVTYDPTTRTYPGFLMNGPGRALVDGTWNEATQTMTFKGKFMDGGGTLTCTNRFIDADHCEGSGTMKDANGKVFLEQTQKQTRRRK